MDPKIRSAENLNAADSLSSFPSSTTLGRPPPTSANRPRICVIRSDRKRSMPKELSHSVRSRNMHSFVDGETCLRLKLLWQVQSRGEFLLRFRIEFPKVGQFRMRPPTRVVCRLVLTLRWPVLRTLSRKSSTLATHASGLPKRSNKNKLLY
jgi:hypothetical protein